MKNRNRPRGRSEPRRKINLRVPVSAEQLRLIDAACAELDMPRSTFVAAATAVNAWECVGDR
ncbi:MAG: hypothetical protein WEG36_12375 [Gemmatimonadota bacterium]